MNWKDAILKMQAATAEAKAAVAVAKADDPAKV